MEVKKEIYMDNAATTRVNEKIAKAVSEIMLESYGNASSLHRIGKKAKKKLNESRKRIADYFGCDEHEIVFTSGGTESNNLAICGLAKAHMDKKHIITSCIEHPSVLETCRNLEKMGYDVDYLDVDSNGMISLDDVRNKIREDTLLVSVMHVNNEIGVIEPVEEIGRICKKRGVVFHSDNVQGFLKENLALSSVDMMSVSGHKVCAPKGVGILYIRDGVRISPILTGGGQESGLRSGTENVPGIVGLALAIDLNFKIDEVRWSRDKMIEELLKIPGTRINGHLEDRVYNNINVSFYGIEGEALMLMLDEVGIFVSTGSACASNKLKESHVLKAIGVDEMYIHGSLRISLDAEILGRENEVVEKIRDVVLKLREMSPFKFDELEGGNSDGKEDN